LSVPSFSFALYFHFFLFHYSLSPSLATQRITLLQQASLQEKAKFPLWNGQAGKPS
jgi:hypothetical protein